MKMAGQVELVLTGDHTVRTPVRKETGRVCTCRAAGGEGRALTEFLGTSIGPRYDFKACGRATVGGISARHGKSSKSDHFLNMQRLSVEILDRGRLHQARLNVQWEQKQDVGIHVDRGSPRVRSGGGSRVWNGSDP